MASHPLCQAFPMWVCVESDEANKHCPLNITLICSRSPHDKQFQITLDGPVGSNCSGREVPRPLWTSLSLKPFEGAT